MDSSYDAAVFLEAGSFDLGGSLGEDVTIEAGNALCSGGSIILDSQLPSADHVWYFDGEVIGGESNSTIEVFESGIYSVDIIFGVECTTSDSILIEYKPSPLIEDLSDLVLCNAGSPVFDLSQNETLILGTQDPNDFNISYHNTALDSENDSNPIITNITNYSIITDIETIYVRIEDAISESCFVTGAFDLVLTGAPPISDVSDLILCDDITNDGVEVFDLDQQTLGVLGLSLIHI